MRKVNFLCLLLFVAFLAACHSNDDTWGDWAKSNEFPGDKRVSAVCFQKGNVAYVGMGYNNTVNRKDKNLRDFWKFDGSNWKRLKDFPADGREGSVAFVIGDTAYVGAGFRRDYAEDTKKYYFSNFYKFDLVNEVWVTDANGYATTDMRTAPNVDSVDCGFYNGIAFSLNGKGYAGTGTVDGRVTKLICSYDPKTGKWEDTGYPGDSRTGAVAFVVQGKAVVCLGAQSTSVNCLDVYVFDGTSWSAKDAYAPLKDLDGSWNDDYGKIPRAYAVAFTSNLDGGKEKAYIAGGSGNGRSCWEYRIDEDRWEEVTNFPNAMGSTRIAAVGFSINGYGYITTGGSSLSDVSDNSTWKFIPGIDEDENNDY